jgi:Flp pilus assembly secretin CpaC
MPSKRTALAIAFAVFVASVPLTRAFDRTIILQIGTEGTTLALDRPFKAILVGDPSIVDVLTQADRWIILKPLGLGATNIVFVDEGNIAIANFRVVVCKIAAKGVSFSEQQDCARELERNHGT